MALYTFISAPREERYEGFGHLPVRVHTRLMWTFQARRLREARKQAAADQGRWRDAAYIRRDDGLADREINPFVMPRWHPLPNRLCQAIGGIAKAVA